VLELLRSFLAHEPRGAGDAKELAVRLARYTHEVRNVVLQGFARGYVSADLRDLRDAVKKELVPDLTDEQFADMFAQTLAYGFFAAWCHHPLNRPFERLGAARDVPKTNPFLRRLFEMTTGAQLDDEPFAGYVDRLVQLLEQTTRDEILKDFGTRTGREDPVVHFYETFLKEYDPKLRELRGVYYTPEPVISYMVRSVDHLLRTRFKCPGGLGDTQTGGYHRQTGGERRQRVRVPAPRVLILDPACGTGGFLYAIVDLIRERFRRQDRRGAWSSFVREQLLPRLFGFELLMAPYAVAHLKLGMALAAQDLDEAERAGFTYDFASDERLGVYLTNSLDAAERLFQGLPGPLRILSDEGEAAAEVKRDKPIMVVIGNPPYSGHSANRSWQIVDVQGETRGKTRRRREPTFIGKLLQHYYQVDGKPLREKNPKWLQDDYVKFIRFGQWRIEQTAEQTGGGGILALITNHSYLDNPTFRGMRQQLMQAFTDIYLLDLHGNSRKKEVCPDGSKDENVFDIQQGVAIAIFVKDPSAAGPARVFHAHLWGLRKTKERFLSTQTCHTVDWLQLQPSSPDYLFVPQEDAVGAEWDAGNSIPQIMPVSSVGIVTARDRLAVGFTYDELLARLDAFVNPSESDDQVKASHLAPRDDLDVKAARQQLREVVSQERKCDEERDKEDRPTVKLIQPCLYRPFDVRALCYHGTLVERLRGHVMTHMLGPQRKGLVLPRRVEIAGPWQHCFVASHIVDHVAVSSKTIDYLFPLHIYPRPGQSAVTRDQHVEFLKGLARRDLDQNAQDRMGTVVARLFPRSDYPRWPNLNPGVLADLEDRLHLRFLPDGRGDLRKTFGPEDVLNYIYAILHCPTYRTRYADFLKRDFPRIPFTSHPGLFATLAGKGAELVGLHIMESPLLAGVMPDFPEPGADTVERVKYDDNNHRVYINKTQYFANVPTNVWGFHIGGYQVCDKWLKDRRGRTLTFDDQQHYQRITVALRETIRLMAEIDALIPGWPLT
jgi:predicted helicase